MNAIECKGLTKAYKTFQLGPVDLTLPMGAILGLVGENGAGKSTILKLILDLIRPNSGEIMVLGHAVPTAYPKLKEDLGVVLDELAIPTYLTAKEVGKLMSAAYSNWDPDTYTQYLTRLDLPANQKYKEFSRGMKMKLSLATALSHHAKLLILDEATSGLDPMVRQEILDILYDVCDEDHAVLLSSHIVSDLEKICDYIAFLHKGKLVLMQEKDLLLERCGLLHCTPEQLNELAPDAVLAARSHHYGTEALVDRTRLPAGLSADRVTLEELIILLAKENQK